MLLEFKFSNYRSYKDEVHFSLVSESARLKSGNIHEIDNGVDTPFRLSKASVIYGPNASGKSNLIKALIDVVNFIINRPRVGQKLHIYSPFQFDLKTFKSPSSFELTFLGPEKIRYIYRFKVMRTTVLEEQLEYYPRGRKNVLFNRIETASDNENDETATVIFRKKTHVIFRNQLFLSKFAEEPDDFLTPVYLYFKNTFSTSLQGEFGTRSQSARTSEKLVENEVLLKQVANLLKAIDTKILNIKIEDIKNELEEFLKKERLSEALRISRYTVFAEHNIYDGDQLIESAIGSLAFRHESQGTQTLYSLGATILDAINNGKTLIVDELDTSLHPYVTRFLVMLFLSSSKNTKGAQLIFSTHDISLLDKDVFRRDQIWFTEKKDNGVTDLYCMQDFEGLREDIPFEKWYMAGKFGALPTIDHIDKVFDL